MPPIIQSTRGNSREDSEPELRELEPFEYSRPCDLELSANESKKLSELVDCVKATGALPKTWRRFALGKPSTTSNAALRWQSFQAALPGFGTNMSMTHRINFGLALPFVSHELVSLITLISVVLAVLTNPPWHLTVLQHQDQTLNDREAEEPCLRCIAAAIPCMLRSPDCLSCRYCSHNKWNNCDIKRRVQGYEQLMMASMLGGADGLVSMAKELEAKLHGDEKREVKAMRARAKQVFENQIEFFKTFHSDRFDAVQSRLGGTPANTTLLANQMTSG